MHLDDELFHVGYIGCWLYLLFPGHPKGYTMYVHRVFVRIERERGRVFGQQRNGRHRSSTTARFL